MIPQRILAENYVFTGDSESERTGLDETRPQHGKLRISDFHTQLRDDNSLRDMRRMLKRRFYGSSHGVLKIWEKNIIKLLAQIYLYRNGYPAFGKLCGSPHTWRKSVNDGVSSSTHS
jgi:hypothetical protein